MGERSRVDPEFVEGLLRVEVTLRERARILELNPDTQAEAAELFERAAGLARIRILLAIRIGLL